MSDISTAQPPKNRPGRPPKNRAADADASADAEEISVQPSLHEIAYWESVKSSRDPEEIELYLEKFPDGFFAELAERRKTQCLLAQATGSAEPEQQSIDGKLSRRRPTIALPKPPDVTIGDDEDPPKYQLLEPFFAENHTWYPVDKVITYYGPPGESMLPMNSAARRQKRAQESWLDECHALKCRAEGIPVSPRPKELADQMAADLAVAQAAARSAGAKRGVDNGVELPPSRPDLARPGAQNRNPRAARMGAVEDGAKYSDRASTADIPILGTEGHRYQRRTQIGGMGAPLPDNPSV